MTNPMRQTFGAIGLTLGLVALMLILILSALHAVGTDDGLYFKLQTEAGILPEAGVSEDELRSIDRRLSDYLRGDSTALEQDSPFNDREMAHMADCLGLFALLRKVRSRLIPWAVLLIVGGAYLLQNRKKARHCAWLAPLILLVPLGAFALWAAIDFDGAFTFFHRVLFSNDLWLLDPRTDLLIRICPESMFAAMGLRIALWSAAAVAGVTALAVLLTHIWPKTNKNEGNTWNENRATRRAAAQRPKTFDVGGKR
jgi:integral membrane protein (TIGR01906 family)